METIQTTEDLWRALTLLMQGVDESKILFNEVSKFATVGQRMQNRLNKELKDARKTQRYPDLDRLFTASNEGNELNAIWQTLRVKL